MPAKPFVILKAPPPPKTASALAKERKLSAQDATAIKRFAATVQIDDKGTITISEASPKAISDRLGSKPRPARGRAAARKK
jgi:hypothetical protein